MAVQPDAKPSDQKAQAILAVCEARLHLTLGLAPFIDGVMKKHVGPTWIDVVRSRRPPDAAPSSLDDATSVADLDDAILLRTMENFWMEAFRKAGLKDAHRGLVTTCLVARNESAHPTGRLVDAQAARSFIVAIHQLLEAVGDRDRSAKVANLKARVTEAPLPPGRGEEIKFELHALEERIREQLRSESEARSKSGQKAGQDLLERMNENTTILREIRTLLTAAPPSTERRKEPATPPSTPRLSHSAALEPATWQIRRNANGSVGAVATTRDGQTLRRLALTPAEARRILEAELVDSAWHAQGGWVFVPTSAAAQLDAELTRRLSEGQGA